MWPAQEDEWAGGADRPGVLRDGRAAVQPWCVPGWSLEIFLCYMSFGSLFLTSWVIYGVGGEGEKGRHPTEWFENGIQINVRR